MFPQMLYIGLYVCVLWSVALYVAKTWTLRRNEQKRLQTFEMWMWRRMERVKWTDKIKNAGTNKEEKINWLGYWLRRNCLLKDALEGMVNGKKVRGRRRY